MLILNLAADYEMKVNDNFFDIHYYLKKNY